MKLILSIIIVSFLSTFCTQPKNKAIKSNYRNPVVAGDFPDPTIIRVGKMYYTAGTSCDFGPNYPIYESTDLINWKQIGAVFNEQPEWASDDFWAPELFYMDGTFYVYYTTKRKDNSIACIGVATTKNIHKGFSDHGIIIEWGEEAIDAFVFKDDDGKLYISWKAYGLTKGRDIEILASELSPDGLSLIGDHFTLTDFTKGWHGAGDEGQCLIKRNGFYYLFYSIGGCCDKHCDYQVMVARSKKLKSGWEQFPEPILQGSEEWLCTGHGTLVTTPDNRDFYMYHSYNSVDFEFIGRQGMLDEVLWNKDTGWPYFKNGIPSKIAMVPFPNTKQNTNSLFFDDFSTKQQRRFWEWDINFEKPVFEVDSGELIISPARSGVSFLGLRPKTGNYSIASEVIPINNFGGIGIYSNEQNLINLSVSKSELVLYQIKNGEKKILANEEIGEMGAVFLKFEALKGRYFHFFWSENGRDWIQIKIGDNYQVDGTFIAQWGFSPRAGFIVNGNKGDLFRFSELVVSYKY